MTYDNPHDNPHGNRGWRGMRDIARDSELMDPARRADLVPPPPTPPVPAPSAPYLQPWERDATTVRACPACGAEQGTVPIYVPMYQRTEYWWADCPCRLAAIADDELQREALINRYDQRQKEEKMKDDSMRRIAHLTLDTFEPGWLNSETPAQHPYAVATAWLSRILPAPHGDYRTATLPPAALYLYSPGKGRGKTHLAAAITNAARDAGKRVAFVEEHAYLQARWGRPIGEAEQLTERLGEQAWLTVIDDLGQRAKAGASVADAWYALFNRRWMQARWTIITSNRTPDELVAQGTINEATYSRIAQMTNKEIITFHGVDQRLV